MTWLSRLLDDGLDELAANTHQGFLLRLVTTWGTALVAVPGLFAEQLTLTPRQTEILELIGKGGFARVYRAKHLVVGREFATPAVQPCRLQ